MRSCQCLCRRTHSPSDWGGRCNELAARTGAREMFGNWVHVCILCKRFVVGTFTAHAQSPIRPSSTCITRKSAVEWCLWLRLWLAGVALLMVERGLFAARMLRIDRTIFRTLKGKPGNWCAYKLNRHTFYFMNTQSAHEAHTLNHTHVL